LLKPPMQFSLNKTSSWRLLIKVSPRGKRTPQIAWVKNCEYQIKSTKPDKYQECCWFLTRYCSYNIYGTLVQGEISKIIMIEVNNLLFTMSEIFIVNLKPKLDPTFKLIHMGESNEGIKWNYWNQYHI